MCWRQITGRGASLRGGYSGVGLDQRSAPSPASDTTPPPPAQTVLGTQRPLSPVRVIWRGCSPCLISLRQPRPLPHLSPPTAPTAHGTHNARHIRDGCCKGTEEVHARGSRPGELLRAYMRPYANTPLGITAQHRREPRECRIFTSDAPRALTHAHAQWVIIDARVFDVTRFRKLHPGGASVFMDEGIRTSPSLSLPPSAPMREGSICPGN